MARNGSDIEFALRAISTHGSWIGMRQRCLNKNISTYKDYGGRGIIVCDRWLKFENFLEDMGVRPAGTSLDRIDFNGNYEPANCRWATRKEQALNRRPTRKIKVDGIEYFACELSKQSGLKTDSILERHARGLSLSEIVAPERRVFHEGLALGGVASGKVKQAKTKCLNGHEFTTKNTFITPMGWRKCRRCNADRQLSYTRRKIALSENTMGI